uniref:Endonuclease/exonuclease/phosphatase domain-containing protein n=1 Tax=Timema douglasi TaxID=61478 RepID=A0A7R8VSC0_TIMDO|nr:unnamed protein product [Timema douglasi]
MGHIFDMFNSAVGSSCISLCLFKRYEPQEEKDTGDTKYQIKPKRDLRSQFLLQMANRERRKREELEEKAKEVEKCAIEHVISLPPLHHMEAMAIQLVTSTGSVHLISIYLPPYHRFAGVTVVDMEALLRGTTPVLIGGDFNAKHPLLGSKIMNARDGFLRGVMDQHSMVAFGPPTPIHIPPIPIGFPNVLNFVVTKGIRQRLALKSLAELDSDHNPVLLNLEHAVSSTEHSKKSDIKCTDWDRFANVLRERLGPTSRFRTAAEIDYGAEFITSTIKEAFEASTLRYRPNRTPQASLPDYILRHVREKNWLRRAWKILNDQVYKANYRRKVHAVREMVQEYRNSVWADKIESLYIQTGKHPLYEERSDTVQAIAQAGPRLCVSRLGSPSGRPKSLLGQAKSVKTVPLVLFSVISRDGLHPPLRQGLPREDPEEDVTDQAVLHLRANLLLPKPQRLALRTFPLHSNTY